MTDAAESPTLSVDGFEGRLDALLEQARAEKLDLTKLSITALVVAFAGALDADIARHQGAPLRRWGDWLVMAATLTWLRSRQLLPATGGAGPAGAEAPPPPPVDQALADWLEQRPQLGHDVFGRGERPRAGQGRRTYDLTALLRACLVALRVPEGADTNRPKPPFWTMQDAVTRITTLLATSPEPTALTALLPTLPDGADRTLRGRAAVASTLTASLELARTGTLTLDQTEAWGPIETCPSEMAMRVGLEPSGLPA